VWEVASGALRRLVGRHRPGGDSTSPYHRWGSPPIGPECHTAESLVPDQRFIALSCWNHGTRVWDTARGEQLADLPSVTIVEGDYYSAFPALTATGDRAAISPEGNTVEVYARPTLLARDPGLVQWLERQRRGRPDAQSARTRSIAPVRCAFSAGGDRVTALPAPRASRARGW